MGNLKKRRREAEAAAKAAESEKGVTGTGPAFVVIDDIVVPLTLAAGGTPPPRRTLKLGKNARAFDPRIPHYSALIGHALLPPIPTSVDYTTGMPADLGVMLNDSLGDCTCAAFYHALQVWDFNANPPLDYDEPNADVLALYEAACGYDPKDPNTDQGGNEQAVLSYLLKSGAPTTKGPHKINAYFEVTKSHTDNVRRTIYECGVAYIGFEVPSFLMNGLTDPGSVWDVADHDTDIEGGHAVILTGYDILKDTYTVVSWGACYTMTGAFFAKYVDEVYGIVDPTWVAATGKTPAGMTLEDLEHLMNSLKFR